MKTLRASLLDIEKKLTEAIGNGADDDYPEVAEAIEMVHNLRANSKIASLVAFDRISNTDQFVIAVNGEDKIAVWGNSTDEFDLELVFGMLARAKDKVKKEQIYKLFLRTMNGDFDD